MAIFSKDWLVSTLRRFLPHRLVGIGLAVLAVSCLFAGHAEAGVMVDSDSSGSIAQDTIAGELASSSTPVPDEPSPLLNEWQGVPLFDGNSPTSGGAGSQTPSGVSGFSVVAVVSESPRTAQSSLISRLTLCSRISLPSPLEDRFFRPPRS